MKKNVYSLVLMESLIAEIDKLAYSMSTSRSNLINQILAEKVQLMTPQMYMRSIFEEIETLLSKNQSFKILQQGSDSLLSIRSILHYKYNPTIKYSITLFQLEGERFGELKIASRTQSEVLQNYLQHFFSIWNTIENQHKLQGFIMDEGIKWKRDLIYSNNQKCSSSELAQAITEYIECVDHALAIYFSHINHDRDIMIEKLDTLFYRYIHEVTIII